MTPLWVQRMAGRATLCIALCIVNSLTVKTVINCLPQREGSSLYYCRGIQPLPVQRGPVWINAAPLSQSPGQVPWVWPGCCINDPESEGQFLATPPHPRSHQR